MASSPNQSLIAVGLEAAPGTFLGTFGVGHMYQGRWGAGVGIMVAYWALQAINAWLVGLMGLGIVTGFLTWLAFLVMSTTDVLNADNK